MSDSAKYRERMWHDEVGRPRNSFRTVDVTRDSMMNWLDLHTNGLFILGQNDITLCSDDDIIMFKLSFKVSHIAVIVNIPVYTL